MKILSALLLIAFYSPALGMSRGYVTPSPSPVATVSPSPSSTPIASETPALQSLVACDGSCSSKERTELPGINQILVSTQNSQCYSAVFENTVPILENKGKVAAQIVSDLRGNSSTSIVTIWWPTLFEYAKGAGKACGFENGDGKIHVKEKCYRMLTACGKASLFAHELAHKVGYTHYTAGNQKAGNEKTVPYLANSAFDQCCL